MNARELNMSLKFIGGMSSLILRDHTNGRVQVWRDGVWIATVVPGHVVAYPEYPAILLSKDLADHYEYEWRGTYGDIACGLSVLQQTNSWDEAQEAFDSSRETTELLFG